MSKRKIATVVLTTVALTAGSFGVANAASKTSRTVVTKSVTKVSQSGAHARGLGGPAAALDSLLSGLVTKGTITQVQADAIKAAALAAAETAKAIVLQRNLISTDRVDQWERQLRLELQQTKYSYLLLTGKKDPLLRN